MPPMHTPPVCTCQHNQQQMAAPSPNNFANGASTNGAPHSTPYVYPPLSRQQFTPQGAPMEQAYPHHPHQQLPYPYQMNPMYEHEQPKREAEEQ